MKYLVILSLVFLTSCSTTGRAVLECKSLCSSGKVNLYKDETLECRCSLTQDTNIATIKK